MLLITTLKLIPKFIEAAKRIAADLVPNLQTSIDCECEVDLCMKLATSQSCFKDW